MDTRLDYIETTGNLTRVGVLDAPDVVVAVQMALDETGADDYAWYDDKGDGRVEVVIERSL